MLWIFAYVYEWLSHPYNSFSKPLTYWLTHWLTFSFQMRIHRDWICEVINNYVSSRSPDLVARFTFIGLPEKRAASIFREQKIRSTWIFLEEERCFTTCLRNMLAQFWRGKRYSCSYFRTVCLPPPQEAKISQNMAFDFTIVVSWVSQELICSMELVVVAVVVVIMMIQFSSLCIYVLSQRPVVNFKISTSKKWNKQTHTYQYKERQEKNKFE